jgi:hypothetical protein
MFDIDKFLESSADTGSTKFEPIPAGEYLAMIDDVQLRAAGSGVVLDVTCLLQAPEVAQKIGREKLSVRSGIFLDLNASGGLDMGAGKNIRLNKLREACGMNTPMPVKQLRDQLKGKTVKVAVTLRPDKNSDAIYNDIKSFGKA